MLGQPPGSTDNGQIESLWLRAAGLCVTHLVFKHPGVDSSEPAARVWGRAVRMDDLGALPTPMKRHEGLLSYQAMAGGVMAAWCLHQSTRK